jgi:glycosyltransferase involved in cell wall biosynthesis
LVVNHAFAHGVPVLTRESELHAPEAEYIAHGRNGLLEPGTFDEFANAVARILDSPERQRELAAGAAATAAELSLDRMADAFDGGVRRAVQAHADRSATVPAVWPPDRSGGAG